ncbi:MAG: hypothetical protein ACYDDS_13490 [Candidatus Sulfotelmatobacter sp.]
MTNKENFIAAVGGFRLESAEQFKARQAEIRRIERRLKSGKYSEQSHRRLCELKDIVFPRTDSLIAASIQWASLRTSEQIISRLHV